ncbi:DUF2243 domain-containing protein [Paenibacillus allorhizosphaerae]|uniref:DUF2243 domain-containing protein n=1 Tax=Paenibacillus allorhizosphaerae TaxID=2849866 RepID=UPI002E77F0E3|nr:DUF2243 domain-containing protein [Paenibacillus allorhizosphaerae]
MRLGWGQWHSTNMHTDRQHQIVSDGIFHLTVTAITFVASIVLWNSDPTETGNRNKLFASGLLSGAGLFNFLEGVINHHILQLHHERPGQNQFFFDLAYDITGILMILIGLALLKSFPGKTKQKVPAR